MLAGRASRGSRSLARLLASNPIPAACRTGGPTAAAEQTQQLEGYNTIAFRAADSASCTGSAVHSHTASPSSHLPQWQQRFARGFADGSSFPDGSPGQFTDSSQRHGTPPQPLHRMQPSDGREAADGDRSWTQPGGGELTPHSQPSQQEGDIDELLERWEEMMDANADPMDILETVWSSTQDVPGLPEWQDILERGDEEEALEQARRRSRERQLQQEFAEKRVSVVDRFGRSYATGKRKTSIARTWLKAGSGVITVNGRPMTEYFGPLPRRADVLAPFMVTTTLGAFDVYSTVRGGGQTGQAQALRHGISRALQLFEPGYRPALKAAGLLTRDSRIVERKKPGLAKARKSFQWVKR